MAAASYSRMRLDELLTRVIELGGDGLEIEYKDGYEEITAMKGNFGFGIGRIKSGSREAADLREELWSLRNRTKRLEVRDTVYKARVSTFESFGETAYRIQIR
jgi:hypothetical protein